MTEPLEEQLAYYRARAGEYGEWWHRRGRYDRGEAHRAIWQHEISVAEQALDEFRPSGDVLEIAAGTGIWSERLIRHAARLTLLDGSPEMLAIARARLGGRIAGCILADIFNWEPDRQYDSIFFSFWLSHVPLDRFRAFWETVRRALRPGGRVFFLDSLREEASTATDHQLPPDEATTLTRKLNDGREFQIVKVFHDPVALADRLHECGWKAATGTTGRFFLYGTAEPAHAWTERADLLDK